MREDMAQVVVERPRHGSSERYHEVRPRGIARSDVDRLADLPRSEGMRRPHVDRKSQSDLLGPLRDEALIGRICDGVALPVNVMVMDGVPSADRLTELGVSRISYGPIPYIRAMGVLQQEAGKVLS